MKKPASKKNKLNKIRPGPWPEPPAQPDVYGPMRLSVDTSFDLEREALQEILDAVIKIQTYIAMREQRG
ncbi:hypothetical protein ACFWQD_03405 [Alcaligenes faecalis]|uniref:hypothetical protein n=1 Tax=Alcaligenes faecalis TaxID=511 RepID=UPI003668B6D6